MAAEAGADLVGLVGPMPSGAGIVSPDTCREIAETCPAWVTPVLLTSSRTSADIIRDIRHAGVRAVQLVRHVEPEVHEDLQREMPGVRRFQVIHVEGADAMDLQRSYPLADAFLLDSGRPDAEELGGTGRTHDWVISSAFVQQSPVPVFLAGGLTPENVTEAIAKVRPFGIDICSGVRTDDRLDADKLAAFTAAVNRTATDGAA
jgi:phosphoribosylanthranilate isomerase